MNSITDPYTNRESIVPGITSAAEPGMTLEESYDHCRRLATTHYENFPVGSVLAPRRLRKHVHAIYAYARAADDIADEGDAPPEERLRGLDLWEKEFTRSLDTLSTSPVFMAVSDTVRQCQLPREPFLDLLEAFRLDVTTTSFERYQDILNYCSNSANPIGRLVLGVFGCSTEETRPLSDAVCTGLQLTNFWQDVAVDARKGRIYLPLEDLRRFGYTKDNLSRGILNSSFVELMKFEIERTRALFIRSSSLPDMVPWRLGLELRATINGGKTILRKIEEAGYDVLKNRPSITTFNKLEILATSFFKSRP